MKLNLNGLKLQLLGLLLVFSFISCDQLTGKDDDDDNSMAIAALALAGSSSGTTTTTVSSDVTGDTSWSGTIILDGKTIFVQSPATLTIAAGTTIYGRAGSALFVMQGAKIKAIGTATSPIVFTSANTAGSRNPGDWGGLVIIGKGIGTRTSTTEGTTPQNYGNGSDNADSSGTLKYVRIEFAGNEVSKGDELNALSSYTVGSGTTYEYIQAHRGLDDSFEFWGGAVNLKYALATGGKDDDFDMDEGYQGKLQFIISHKYATSCGGTDSDDPHGMEMDGSHDKGKQPEVTGGAYTNPKMANFTVIGANVPASIGMRLREGMTGSFTHGLIYGFNTNNIKCDANSVSGGSATNPTINNVLIDSSKTNNLASSCTSVTPTSSLSALPITSLGTESGCIYTVNPDYSTLSTLSAAPALSGDFTNSFFTANTTYGAYDGSTKWWDGWTTYNAK